MSGDDSSWAIPLLGSRAEMEETGRNLFQWCKEHPIQFSAYATFILLSLFPVFVFLVFAICSVVGTLLFLLSILLMGLVVLALVCSMVICCSGCVAACVTGIYFALTSALRLACWVFGSLPRSSDKGD